VILSKIYWRARLELSKMMVSPRKLAIQSIEIEGFRLLARINEDVGRIMRLSGHYEVAETRFFQKNVKSDAVCFDVGGNVGFFSMLLSQTAKDGHVHVFEPIPLNAQLIETSATLNSFKNLTINNCAVGASVTEVEFTVSEDSAYSSMIDTERSRKSEVLTVPLTTLDHYMAENGVPKVDILKIDVEGAEADVVKGAANLLADPERRPRFVMIELSDINLVAFGETVESVTERLEGLSYRPNALLKDGGLAPLTPADLRKHYNFVFEAV